MRAGLAAVAVFVAGGAVLAVSSTGLRFERFLSLSRGMGRGLSGLPVAVGDLLAAPNAVLAGTSYLAGPGFAIGHDATYAPFGGHGGLVPAFPVLAGLPVGEHASLTVLGLMLVTVAGAGLIAGLIVHRELRAVRWTTAVLVAVAGAASAGLGVGVLAALAGGPLGHRQLRTVGAAPAQVGLAVLAEVALVAMATVVIARLFARSGSADAGGASTSTARPMTVDAEKVPPEGAGLVSRSIARLASVPTAVAVPLAAQDVGDDEGDEREATAS